MKMTEEMWEQMIAEVNEDYDARTERNTKADCSVLWDEEEAVRYAYRKRDWHKNKGKRRIKVGHKEMYV